jgi:glutamine cyclotransferase
MRAIFLSAICFFGVLACACGGDETPSGIRAETISFEVLQTLPHDATRYTQGLVIDGEHFIESSGRYGRSALYETDLRSDRVLRSYPLPDSVFAEGIALLAGEIHLLSWREQRGFVFTRDFQLRREVVYEGEGWGLASDGRDLVRSDGSARLRFIDPPTHRVLRELEVHEGDRPLQRLNELEYARGFILANIWLSDRVALIDPRDGAVRAWLDLASLRARLDASGATPPEALNGLAYDAARDLLYATGKLWPATFVLRVHWPPSPPDAELPKAPEKASK